MNRDLIPFREWCKLNGFGLTTGYKILNSGDLKAVKVGKLTYITAKESARWTNNLPAYIPEREREVI